MVRSLPVFASAIALLLILPAAPARGQCRVSQAGIALHATQNLSKAVICPSAVDSLECDMTTAANLGETYRVLVVAVDLPGGGGNGLGALELEVGIDYNGIENEGVDILNWVSCSDLSTAENNWPEPGGGHVFRYTSCQEPRQPAGTRADLVLGWFDVYAHSPDGLELTDLAYRDDRFPRHTTCDLIELVLDPLRLGSVAFGGSQGFDPCTDVVDAFPGPCCLADSCAAVQYYVCCELAGGTSLPYYNTCEDCGALPTTPTTWGRIKSTYED